VTAGNDRGKVGEILRVIPAEDRIIVQGVNIRVRHLKPTQQNPKGGLLRKEMPIHISNVSPVVDGRGTRVRFEKREDGSKVRLAVRGGKELSVLRGPKQG
jgi:large subunit ribosomal protein L24